MLVTSTSWGSGFRAAGCGGTDVWKSTISERSGIWRDLSMRKLPLKLLLPPAPDRVLQMRSAGGGPSVDGALGAGEPPQYGLSWQSVTMIVRRAGSRSPAR